MKWICSILLLVLAYILFRIVRTSAERKRLKDLRETIKGELEEWSHKISLATKFLGEAEQIKEGLPGGMKTEGEEIYVHMLSCLDHLQTWKKRVADTYVKVPDSSKVILKAMFRELSQFDWDIQRMRELREETEEVISKVPGVLESVNTARDTAQTDIEDVKDKGYRVDLLEKSFHLSNQALSEVELALESEDPSHLSLLSKLRELRSIFERVGELVLLIPVDKVRRDGFIERTRERVETLLDESDDAQQMLRKLLRYPAHIWNGYQEKLGTVVDDLNTASVNLDAASVKNGLEVQDFTAASNLLASADSTCNRIAEVYKTLPELIESLESSRRQFFDEYSDTENDITRAIRATRNSDVSYYTKRAAKACRTDLENLSVANSVVYADWNIMLTSLRGISKSANAARKKAGREIREAEEEREAAERRRQAAAAAARRRRAAARRRSSTSSSSSWSSGGSSGGGFSGGGFSGGGSTSSW